MIKVTNAITYEIRDDNGSHPVFITINADGHSCHFTGSGDYGDYSHYWGSMGSEYREFLTSLDYGYFMQKITDYGESGSVIDCEKSKPSLKIGLLKDYRRLLEMYPEKRNELRKEIKFIFNAIDTIHYDFDNELYEKTKDSLDLFWSFFSDGTPCLEYKRDGQCEGFWRQFQKLCDLWKKELNDKIN